MFVSLLIVLLISTSSNIETQSCNPASVTYMVRDEKGNILTDTELKTISDQLPKTIGDANINRSEVSFVDSTKYYWPESADWSKGTKKSVLEMANAGTCTMKLKDVVLTYHSKQMHLIFNIDISRSQNDRRMVIDSLPFQEGTFELQKMTPRETGYDQLIPATSWKKVANQP
jgi:hypothetical protein